MTSLPEIVINHTSGSDRILDIGGKHTQLFWHHNRVCDPCSIGGVFHLKKSYDVVMAYDIFGIDAVGSEKASDVLLGVQCVLKNKGFFFCNLKTHDKLDAPYFESLLRLFAHTHNNYGGTVEKIGENTWKCLYRS